MSDEHDSWFKDAFGVDLGQVAQGIKDEASAAVGQVASTVTQVVQSVQGAVEGAIDSATGAATGVAKKVAGAVLPSGDGGGSSAPGGGTGSFPLGGSVGRGGKNAPNDVRAVQTALGLSADGQCGSQTISAIEAFQRSIGQANPDGRVDAGAGTERALAGGTKPSSAPAASPATADGDDSSSLLGQFPTGPSGLPATNAGILETAKAALIAVGEVTGVSGAARQVEAAASGAANTAEQAGSIVADDPFSAAVGFGFGAVQGVAPGGFLVPSPKPESKAFELGRGVGLIGGGIAAVAIGGGEEVIGTGLDVTGIGAVVGVPVNILGAVTIASGVASAGVGVATVGGVLATGGGGSPAKGTPTEVDPAKPPPEPETPKANVQLTPEQARQNLIDAVAKQKATEKASREATEEFVRFRALKPNPARGVEGDPSKFDPVVSEALEDQMLRAQRADEEAVNELKAAQQAARDAAGRAKGSRGGGGFPAPR